MSSEDVDDKLSTLPNEIVSHILSLMPTRFAVRTSILSKRWRYRWMFVTILDIDDTHVNSPLGRIWNLDFDANYSYHGLNSLTKFVDRVLEFYKSSQVKLFRLHIVRTMVCLSRVSKWIKKAVSLNVREFDIQLIWLDNLPSSLFTCKTLTKLRLHPRKGECVTWDCPYTVNLPCLKTLDIAVFTNPFVGAFKIIHGCPILESLSFEVELCQDEEDYIFNIPSLKLLKLKVEGAIRVNKVVLNVPNLEYLFVGGELFSCFIMEDVSSLVEASVSFTGVRFDHLWVELLKGLHGVTSLSVQHVKLCDPIISFISPFPVFPNMKHLELNGILHYSGLISHFLESCPQLEHLSIENVDDMLLKPEESSWIEPKLVPACMITSLATIKFSKCEGLVCCIKFLEYMLANAKILKTITIIWEKLPVEEETWLCAHLLKVPRASQCCEIYFHGYRSPSTSS